MELSISIKKIKNIDECIFKLPIEKGVYCLVGSNGCGKSTVMSCVAQSVFSSSLLRLSTVDYSENSFVALEYDGKKTTWSRCGTEWRTDCKPIERVHFNGMYEGSLFYGTRFDDSLRVDDLVEKSTISPDDIVDADDYIKEKMSYILHGDLLHYRDLKRIRNKKIAQNAGLNNTPYFNEIKGNLISQYKMSSGECVLVSLLHFIYNALIRRSLPDTEPILMLIDEIELALHPVAVSRLIDLLNQIIKEHDNLTVLLTSHSPEVIRKISANNLYMMETDNNGDIQFHSPCYPSYAIRDVYMHSGFDYVLLVEDMLAKYVVEKIIQNNNLCSSKLINVLPIGGWENVLKFQLMAYNTNTFGIGSTMFSILDGDVQGNPKLKDYKRLQKTFLPISSIEKYLHKVCIDMHYKDIKRRINDTFFNVESIDDILAEYVTEGDNSGKVLYRKLINNIEKRGISEDSFVKSLCDIIMDTTSFEAFTNDLTSRLRQ